MSSDLHAKAELCPQCGAPLELDENGQCKWCRAVVRVEIAEKVGQPVDDGLGALFDLCGSGLGLPLPAMPLLSGLWMLGKDPGVQRELGNPTFLAEVRKLTDRIEAAGDRAGDAGLGSITWPNWLKDYSPEELWSFRLGVDLMAWMIALPGVEREHVRLGRETVEGWGDLYGKQVTKAIEAPGVQPADLAGLREKIPSSQKGKGPETGKDAGTSGDAAKTKRGWFRR